MNVSSPFFIVGTGRCGTTMLRKLLQMHHDVHIPKETHFFPLLYDSFGQREVDVTQLIDLASRMYLAKGISIFDRICTQQSLERAQFLADVRDAIGSEQCTVPAFMTGLYSVCGRAAGCSIVGDKTPDYGFCMGDLQQSWPNARFVHIFRDGRDVALSMRRVMSFRFLAAWKINHWWPIGLDRMYESKRIEAEGDLAVDVFFELWLQRFERIRDEATRLQPGSNLEIAYEQVLADAHGTLSRIASFLSLPADEGWIERAAATVRSDNVSRNLEDADRRELTVRHAGQLRDLGLLPN
ncbi:MAG: sulfotransferase family protein [Phycisphaerales bacterium]